MAGLAGHAIFDAVRGHVLENPGVPVWWPTFCLAFDVGAAGCLAWIQIGKIVRGSTDTACAAPIVSGTR